MRRVFFVLVLAILANVCGLSGQESIPVDSVHFPDARFREYVMANFDADANGILESSELDAVDSIDFGDGHWIYTSLEGIEHFWNLKYLDCGLQELTSLDVTRNAELRYLHCAANDLTVLDVSRNTKLKRLTCWGCLLETLDLSNNALLEEFEGSGGGWLVPFNPDSTYNLKRGIGAIPGVEDLSRTANWRNAELVDSLVRILDFNCAFSYDYDTRCPNGDFYLSVGLLSQIGH